VVTPQQIAIQTVTDIAQALLKDLICVSPVYEKVCFLYSLNEKGDFYNTFKALQSVKADQQGKLPVASRRVFCKEFS
jgi:hypothetical protein